jgi:hypothetical protein
VLVFTRHGKRIDGLVQEGIGPRTWSAATLRAVLG